MITPPILKDLVTAQDINLLLENIAKNDEQLIYGLTGVQKNILFSLIGYKHEQSMLIVCESPKRAKEVWDDLNYLLPNYEVLYFPALEVIPFEVLAQSIEIQRQRLQVLANLVQGKKVVVVCPIESLAKRLIPPQFFKEAIIPLKVGQVINLDDLKSYLVKYGYEKVEQIQSPGQYSLRGGILDIYSAIYENPIRIEFFDDEVDSIRFFAIESQRSLEKIGKISLFPAREIFFKENFQAEGLEKLKEEFALQKERLVRKKDRDAVEKLTSKINEVIEKIENNLYFPGVEQYQSYFYPELSFLMNYFPPNSFFCIDEPLRVREAQEHKEKDRRVSFTDLLTRGFALPGQESFYADFSDILKTLEISKRIYLSLLPKTGWDGKLNNLYGVDTKTIPPFFGKIRILADEIKEWKRRDYKIVILVTSPSKADRLKQALFDCDVEATWVGENYELKNGKVLIAQGNLSAGVEFIKSKLVIITEKELFNQPKKHPPKRMFQKEGQKINKLDDLKIGDYVVHSSHGIGRYLGVEKLKIGDIEKDYLVIKYLGEDKLYVPADQVGLLQKYVASEGKTPRVHKLGGTEWQKTKFKVQSSVKQLAEGLLELYAQRKSKPGFAFLPDDSFQQEFEDSFPYKETPDQLRSIKEVKEDMEKAIPMDRLVCGDVGYGKTEIAIRAAFKAVNSGKQVAILVPTTVLAQQHYNTFQERFVNYPVKIEVLSRFRSSKEQKQIIEHIKEGQIDIIIGTHKLLSKQIKFKDLGLLVVDEEQRFGVSHKEKIKKIKSEVDVLTLSATPIPRTLHMSLIGIRDLSIIETPPEDRYPIQTYVVEYSEDLIKDAIRRELGRGGQVYYVHNRVEGIEKVARGIESLVPEARIGIAHGQLPENALENIMMQFMEHELDILICTTIIETGLDVSNVNTLIVAEADKMGLSQLYQLRGRVGRTNRVAYAYLTYKKDKILTTTAEKRLHAIREFTELGSGFKIAMRDLEIRGAGNLLGPEQHGHVAAVGFDMYCKLLDEAVKELKGEKDEEQIDVEIDLQISSYIPQDYIRDSASKLDFYQRISLLSSINDILDLEDELVDRFGDIPEETNNLLQIARIKIWAKKACLREIKQKNNFVHLTFAKDPGLSGEELINLAQKYRRKLSFSSQGELGIKINISRLNANKMLILLENIVKEIARLVYKE